MPKLKYKDFKEDATFEKIRIQNFWRTYFYSLFMNAYKFTNLSKEQSHYLLKALWMKGTICAFIIDGTQKKPSLNDVLSNATPSSLVLDEEKENGLICFVPYATMQYNIDDFPSVVSYVAKRGATFIPQTPQIVNENCVIGFAHPSHSPISQLMDFFIDKIVDVEMTINTNLFAHKMPRLIVCSPTDKKRVEDIIEAIERGEHKIFLDADDYNAIKNVLEGGQGNYIVDKLKQYEQTIVNEALTFLGINNVQIQKAERLITAEAESNDELINDNSDCFLDNLKDFCESIKNVLKYNIEVDAKSSPSSNKEKEVEEDENDEENDLL